ncbi:hypothetical protein K438DRAFT_2016585 [Mycena galopus ATCC 62051]|nr:hypothetical protein K438DRAFT_2016585 [Mycena galopus ATCC 62051]
MIALDFDICLEVLGLFLVLACSLAQYLQRRTPSPRRAISSLPRRARQPLLGVSPNLDTRHFVSLRSPFPSPIIVNRRQFSAPGSPNQQLLSPRQRQIAQRRLSYELNFPSTPLSPFLAPPVCGLGLRVDSPVHAANTPSSPFHNRNADFTARLLAGPPRSPSLGPPHSPLVGPLPSPVAPPVAESPASLFVECSHPPHSPLVPTPSPPGSTVAQTTQPAEHSPAGLFVERWESDLTSAPASLPCLDSVPLETPPSRRPEPTSPPQTIPSDAPPQPIASSTSPLFPLPSPIPADLAAAPSGTQRRIVRLRRAPSIPLSVRSPSPEPESDVVVSIVSKTSDKMKRHSMVFGPSMSPSRAASAVVADLTSPVAPMQSEETSPKDGSTEPVLDPKVAGETVEDRFPLADMHNTPPPARTVKKHVVDPSDFLASTFNSRSRPAQLAVLFSPTKIPRRVAGLNPVYDYCPEAPAAVVAKNIVRRAQNDFKDFSATLGARFEEKGWAVSGPSELAAVKKKAKKRRNGRAGAKDPQPKPPSLPPTPILDLLPAFEQLETGSPSTKPQDRIVIDLTVPTITPVCHPDCADVYCAGECSAVVESLKCE